MLNAQVYLYTKKVDWLLVVSPLFYDMYSPLMGEDLY